MLYGEIDLTRLNQFFTHRFLIHPTVLPHLQLIIEKTKGVDLMKKKIGVVLATLALVATMAVPAFADSAADAKAWFDQRFAAKKAAVEQAVESGRITAEQGEAMQQHFDQMYQFHEQNGFTCPYGTPGQGQGFGHHGGKGFGGGMGMGFGAGGGMGFGANAQQQ
jgi:hypothetical protein